MGFRYFSKAILGIALAIMLVFSCGGCSTLKYLFQASRGQMALIQHAKPLNQVIQDEKTPPRTRALLEKIEHIKKFGEVHGLKPTLNYSHYVNLNRSAAVWVVSACDPLRFQAKEWSFPFVGSFPYLGWFDSGDAQSYASDLKKEGWDTDVRGAGAYSTLGWFKDAILSTMISSGDEALGGLANVVLHESVHATLYIQNQSFFNESLASFIADDLTLKFLEQFHYLQEKASYLDFEKKMQWAQKKLHQVYQELDALYASSLPKEEKLLKKSQLLEGLQRELGWKREINNATLIQYKTYHSGGRGFAELFQACGFDSKRFISVLSQLNPQSFTHPQQDEFREVLLRLAPLCVGS